MLRHRLKQVGLQNLKSYSVVVDEKSGEITVETDPTSYGNLQNHNESVLSQQTTVDEEIVPTKPLKLRTKVAREATKERNRCHVL